MRKTVNFVGFCFTSNQLKELISRFIKNTDDNKSDYYYMRISFQNEELSLDKIDEFYRLYTESRFDNCYFSVKRGNGSNFEYTVSSLRSSLSVEAEDHTVVDGIFDIASNTDDKNKRQLPPADKLTSKKVSFNGIAFDLSVIKAAIATFDNICKNEIEVGNLSISIANEEWITGNTFDFYEKYKRYDFGNFSLEVSELGSQKKLSISSGYKSTLVQVNNLNEIETNTITSIFIESDSSSKKPFPVGVFENKRPIVFIGHGRNNQWEKLKSHLHEKHDLDVEAYETGNRAGHTIRDILESMSDEASIAFLVLTGEDKTENGVRARQNVIHECGLFQGKLGFDRAIMLVENGIELASNFDGIQQLRFRRGRISEVFGDVIATIRREFGPV